MKVRKFLFAVLGAAALVGGSFCARRAKLEAPSGLRWLADGSDPMPLPRPTRGTAVVADRKAAMATVLVADGSDPMPFPRPPRRLA